MQEDELHELVAEEASEWMVRLDTATPAVREQFWAWARQSPLHMKEAFAAALTERLINESSVERRACDPPPLVPLSERAVRLRRLLIPLTAVVLLTVPGVLNQSGPDRTIHTDIGVWATKVLDDGSVLRVGPGTQLTIEFDERQRSIELDRGEALFEVAKDSARRFIVYAGAARVEAMGTRFEVAQRESGMRVAVTEGVVSVAREEVLDSAASSAQRVILKAGEEVMVSAAGLNVRAIDTRHSLQWERQRIIFDHAPVGQAVLEFNRRNRLQIVVADQALAMRPITGVFAITDPESFAAFIAKDNAAEIRKRGDVSHVVPSSPWPREEERQ